MNFCVFQGTFNPIHKAHIKVAEYALDYYKFEKIIFIPAYIPPHKEIKNDISQHRFNMVKLAIQNNKKFEISDIEFKREGNSYTYLTILELIKIYNVEKINFLIGTDAFRKIETWYETDKLKKLVHFIVFYRDDNFEQKEFDYLKNNGYDFEFAKMDYIDVSSTEIRTKISEGSSIEDIEIPEVMEYIKENGLYKMA